MPPLFLPFRALGYITEDVPFATQRLGRETFVTVSVGNTWQVYNCAKLTLSLVGPELPGTILGLANNKDLTFAAVGSDIWESKRLHRTGKYSGHSGPIIQLLRLGKVLLSLGADRKLVVWDIGTYNEPQAVIELDDDFQPTCMAHPDTYLNKVVIGSTSGHMQLWNFATGTKLYTFKLAPCRICCIVSSPALDVVGLGLSDGRALVHNLKFDEGVAAFANAAGAGARNSLLLSTAAALAPSSGECTAISFRTGAGVPLMASGGSSGAITVWNLEERRLHTIIRDAHDAPLLSLHFFAGEPRLMSSAADNSVKQWLFDSPDGSARLLRHRSGHSATPSVVRHYGDGNRLLSAGEDRAFRMFSVIQDQQSRELSQGHIAKRAKKLKIEQAELKLPPVVDMAACQVRERDWANVVTAHKGDTSAYTWRLQHFTLGEHVLKPPAKRRKLGGKPVGPEPPAPTPVTSVAVSSCGNFGFVGTEGGRVDRYNLQSGLHRGEYSREPSESTKARRRAHDGGINGLASDGCNHTLVTGGQDGFVRTWHFKKQTLRSEVDLGCEVTRLASHPATDLVAVAAVDHVLRVLDVETGKQVRTFAGHQGSITDLSISADARWLLSASADGTLRVWDIPAARTLQVMRLGGQVQSFSLGPGQEVLATAHAGKKGIYLWANQFIFGGAADIMPSDEPVDIGLPSIAAERDASEDSQSSDSAGKLPEEAISASAKASQNGGGEGPGGAPTPLLPHLVTLSMLPKSQWQNLAHLDAIKERSKPVQPPQKPEAAPFFLPTLATLEKNPVFNTEASAPATEAGNTTNGLPGWGEEGDEGEEAAAVAPKTKRHKKDKMQEGAGGSRVLRNAGAAGDISEFVRALRQGEASGDFSGLVQLLRSMSPVAVDQQLQSMQIVDLEEAQPEEMADLGRVLAFAEAEVAAGRSFEHIQALIKAFLNSHGGTIAESEELRIRARSLEGKISSSWGRLDKKLQQVRCLVNFLGNLP